MSEDGLLDSRQLELEAGRGGAAGIFVVRASRDSDG